MFNKQFSKPINHYTPVSLREGDIKKLSEQVVVWALGLVYVMIDKGSVCVQ